MAKKTFRNKVTDEVRVLDTVADAAEIADLSIPRRQLAGAGYGLPADVASDWDDVSSAIGGGGGSAFAHLTEDDHGVYVDLIADYRHVRIQRAAFPAVGYADLAGSSIFSYLHAGAVVAGDSVYELWPDQGNGNYPIFQWNEDGSLHWGDGTNPPDVSLMRDIVDSLTVVGDGSQPTRLGTSNDEWSTGAALFSDGSMELISAAPGSVGLSHVASKVVGIAGSGGGIQLTSPDGLVTKTIQISNAGAVVAV